jgi:hypothetical protein
MIKAESIILTPLLYVTNLRASIFYYTKTIQSKQKKHSPSHKVKAVDLLDSKLNEVCEKEVSVVKKFFISEVSSITHHG